MSSASFGILQTVGMLILVDASSSSAGRFMMTPWQSEVAADFTGLNNRLLVSTVNVRLTAVELRSNSNGLQYNNNSSSHYYQLCFNEATTRNKQMVYSRFCPGEEATMCNCWSLSHTNTQPFYGSLDFVWDNPGEPVPEETFTHSQGHGNKILFGRTTRGVWGKAPNRVQGLNPSMV